MCPFCRINSWPNADSLVIYANLEPPDNYAIWRPALIQLLYMCRFFAL